MLFTSLTTLIVYPIKKVWETYWCSSRIAFQEKRRDWILRIFTFSDRNPLNLCIISTLQFFWGSKWIRSNPISHKTIWYIPNINNSQFKLKTMLAFFQTPFYFSFIFLDNTSHKFWDQTPSSRYQCCLQVSETVSWHKLQSCHSSNMLQHWVGGRGLTYFCKVDYSRFFMNFSRS